VDHQLMQQQHVTHAPPFLLCRQSTHGPTCEKGRDPRRCEVTDCRHRDLSCCLARLKPGLADDGHAAGVDCAEDEGLRGDDLEGG
jgi:hypothetical protein